MLIKKIFFTCFHCMNVVIHSLRGKFNQWCTYKHPLQGGIIHFHAHLHSLILLTAGEALLKLSQDRTEPKLSTFIGWFGGGYSCGQLGRQKNCIWFRSPQLCIDYAHSIYTTSNTDLMFYFCLV